LLLTYSYVMKGKLVVKSVVVSCEYEYE